MFRGSLSIHANNAPRSTGETKDVMLEPTENALETRHADTDRILLSDKACAMCVSVNIPARQCMC